MERSLLKCRQAQHTRDQHRQSYDEYKLVKVLPHIKEEFHYRVENRLMVQKIINPRRDKTIIQSLAQTSIKSFSKKKKRNRNKTSLDHRRKVVASGSIKKQIRPQTCQIESQNALHNHLSAIEIKLKEHYDKKECFSSKQETFQIPNHSPNCRWLITDLNCLRKSSVGRIIKNNQVSAFRSIKQTVYPTNRDGKIQNTTTLPSESQKNCAQNEKKSMMLSDYLKTSHQNIRKLERKAFHQHFHNKENALIDSKY